SKDCFKSHKIQKIKSLKENLLSKVSQRLEKEKELAREKVDSIFDKVSTMEDYQKLSSENKDKIKSRFDQELKSIQSKPILGLISDSLNRFENSGYNEILNEITSLASPLSKDLEDNKKSFPETNEKSQTENVEIRENKPQVSSVSSAFKKQVVGINKIDVSYSKPLIENESELEEYINLFKKAVLDEIKKGKRVQV
ncbi:MAG: hypothetical protein ACQESP_11360, partial [Candidatus Muiribacteriota bacterium]